MHELDRCERELREKELALLRDFNDKNPCSSDLTTIKKLNILYHLVVVLVVFYLFNLM